MNFDKSIARYEEDLRNNMIANLYQYMKELDMGYSQRIAWLTKKFFLTDKRIEQIIKEYSDAE